MGAVEVLDQACFGLVGRYPAAQMPGKEGEELREAEPGLRLRPEAAADIVVKSLESTIAARRRLRLLVVDRLDREIETQAHAAGPLEVRQVPIDEVVGEVVLNRANPTPMIRLLGSLRFSST